MPLAREASIDGRPGVRRPGGFLPEPDGRTRRRLLPHPVSRRADLFRPGEREPCPLREARGRNDRRSPADDGGRAGGGTMGFRRLPVGVQRGRPGAQKRHHGGEIWRGKTPQVPLSLAEGREILPEKRLGGQEAGRAGRLDPGQPGPERHGPRPAQHVLCPGPGTAHERRAGGSRGRTLPGQRRRELRHGRDEGQDGRGRRGPALCDPRPPPGKGARLFLRVRESGRPLLGPDLGHLG